MTTPQDPFARPEGTPPQGYGYGPPPQQPYQQPYQQQQWTGGQQTETKAIVALVLAILSFVTIPVVPAIIALVLAGQSRRDIAASGGRLTGESLVTAARIISWINIGLAVAAVVLFVLFFGVVAVAGFS